MTVSPRGRARTALFVVDRRDWALGTLAEEMGDSLRVGFAPCILSQSELLSGLPSAYRLSRRATVVHFLSAQLAAAFGWLGAARPSLVTLTHLEEGDDALYARLKRLGFRRFVAMSEMTARVARASGVAVEHVWRPGSRPSAEEPVRRSPRRPVAVVGFSGKVSSDSVGRKGIDILVEVVTRVAREVGLAVRLCGEGWEPLAVRLRATGVNAELVSPNSRPEVLAFYRDIDVYLCTSRLEGGPLPVIEAMAAGCCVVSTRVGFVPEVIEPGVNGIVCDVDDVGGLTEALKRVCGDLQYRASLGRAAAARIRESWYWGHDRGNLHRAYADALSDQPLRPSLALARAFLQTLYSSVATRLVSAP